LVHRSCLTPGAVSSVCAPQFSFVTPVPTDAINRNILSCRSTSSRVLLSPRFAPLLGRRLSWVFQSLFSAIERAGYISRGCHPRVPLPRLRFLPAIAAIASSSLVPGLFHPRSTPEVHSSGLSPRTAAQVVAPLEYPLAVITVATAAPSSAFRYATKELESASGFCSPSESVRPRIPVKVCGRPLPS